MAWTARDIREYTPREYAPLQAFYDANNLPATNPEARAEFLAEKVLQLGMTDHAVLMRTASDEGKAAALAQLEDMVISNHKDQIAKVSADIQIPIP